ncbi:MAG TPA: hypothetical protein ENN51_07390 [candidate division WOR-3 bacterium]|uniref:Uncharacterized protein n=1 Tax=candidate division WOR-3 bacterium TaxID=2052148 RepID=A0A7V0XFV1_UNCW3|nr:hypothetical protein [candidate division WOR-3 bacterium]
MRGERVRQVVAIAAVAAAALTFARLADAIGKRELVRVASEVGVERSLIEAERRELETALDHLEQDRLLLDQRITFMSRSEHYLVIRRSPRVVKLMLGGKEMLEVRYRLRGPVDGVREFLELPKGGLEVLGKRVRTDWYRPDWLYRLESIEPPADSAARLVADAFGPGELFLGAGIAIHGPVREEVPPEALDHTWIELDAKSLGALMNVIEPGSRVFID